MKKFYVSILAVFILATLFMVGGISETKDVQAATDYVRSPYGNSKKCGSYYVKYKSDGIYVKKSSGSWKHIVKLSKQCENSFTSNGTYIYYGVTSKDPNSGYIYRVKTDGTGKKLIRKCKHPISVSYYYDGKVVYESFVFADKYWQSSEREPYLYSYNIKKDKYTKIAEFSDVRKTKGKYVLAMELTGDPSPVKMTIFNLKNEKGYSKNNVAPFMAKFYGDRVYYAACDSKWDTYSNTTWKVYSAKMDLTDKKVKGKSFKAVYVSKLTDKYVEYDKQGYNWMKTYRQTYSTGTTKCLSTDYY